MDCDLVANMSDHLAMIWKINCKCTDENKRVTWRLNSTNCDDYRQTLENYMVIWDKKVEQFEIGSDSINYKSFIDDLTDFLAKSIRMATRITVGIKTITNNSKPWMTREIKDLTCIKNKYRCKFEKTKRKGDHNTELKRMCNGLDKLKKKVIKLCKRKVNMDIGKF